MLQKIFTKKFFIITSLVLAFLVIVYFIFFNSSSIKNIKLSGPFSAKKNCQSTRQLDGRCVEENQDKIWPVAIMIDNHPDAWPQYALNSAQIIYNTLVEGGATRMMAIFSTTQNLEKIGPIRSARLYYLTWVKGLNSLYVHAGGSPDALQKIIDWQILDLNEITSYGPRYIFRDYNFLAPHNLFTSSEKLDLARQDWEINKDAEFTTWQFDSQKKYSGDSANEISIKYSQIYPYDIKYEYNSSTQTYLRFQNRRPQLDALDNSQISTKNLILQFVPKEIHLDNEDRLAIETLGQGEMWYFVNGEKISGTWQKPDLTSRTMYFDENGQEMIFQPGNFWIEVIPAGKSVIVK